MDTSKYLALYLSEARDHLQNMEQMLDRLAGGDEDEHPLNELFRSAHSLKGMSAAMGQMLISERAHELEGLLQPYRDSGRPPEEAVLAQARMLAEELAAGVEEVAASGGTTVGTETPEAGEAVGSDSSPAHAASDTAPTASKTPAPERTLEVTIEMRLMEGSSPARAYEIALAVSDAGQLLGTYPFFFEELSGGQGLRLVLHLRTSWPAARLQQALAELGRDLRVRIVPIPDPTAQHPSDAFEPAVEPVKLDVAVLERLMSRSASLTTAVRQLTRDEGHRPNLISEIEALAEGISAEVAQARLRPLADLAAALPSVARTVARSRGREVHVTVDMGDIELDRTIVERLRDPLVHLVRNAVDHGLENPDERRAAHKPAAGKVSLVAERRGPRVEVRIEDDGQGIDVDAVTQRAVSAGVVSAEEAERLSEQEKLLLVCRPGLSTVASSDQISGRGVGMDVVAEAVRSVGGGLRIETETGVMTRFTLWLPAAVMSESLVLVRLGESEMYGLPQRAVRAVLARHGEKDGQADAYEVDGEGLAAHSLAEELGRPASGKEGTVVVIETGRGRRAFLVNRVVDRVIGVIRPLRAPLSSIPGLLGYAKAGGQTLFVLDPERLPRANP